MEDLASIIWGELRRYVNVVDRAEAAENLVSILIDNDCDPEAIRDAFKGDADIKKAMASYLDTQEQDDSEDYEEDEDYNEDDWEN